MLNWIVWNRTVYMYKNWILALNNLQWLMCHKTKPTSGWFSYLWVSLRNNSFSVGCGIVFSSTPIRWHPHLKKQTKQNKKKTKKKNRLVFHISNQETCLLLSIYVAHNFGVSRYSTLTSLASRFMSPILNGCLIRLALCQTNLSRWLLVICHLLLITWLLIF